MGPAEKQSIVTIEEALALPESERFELIRGTLVQKAMPNAEHSDVQGALTEVVRRRYAHRPGGRWPGGWWIFIEADIQLGDELFRPDLAGWRRDRLPERPKGRPVRAPPDWICEVLSPSTEQVDRVDKLQSYLKGGVGHYWLADPIERVLEVYRRTETGYLLALSAKSGQTIRAEPFHAVELRVDELFGDDPLDDD